MTPPPKAVPPIPEGCFTVMPWIISRDTARLLDFLKHAFGAQELSRLSQVASTGYPSLVPGTQAPGQQGAVGLDC
jgi:hypothetical protein